MKILYSIQGTGNGHLARATEIVPILQQFGETDILVSGIQGDLNLPFEVKYRLYGFSFIFGKKGGVDIIKTVLKFKLFRLIRDIFLLPVNSYDVVINDFEPVSAWACKIRRKKCIGVSHQNAVLHKNAPKPCKKNLFGILVLKHYAPSKIKYGFHFKQLDHFNFTPVIRPAIRKAKPKNKGHYTVYLPAFSDNEIKSLLLTFPQIKWEVFTKHSKQSYQVDNLKFFPISFKKFNQSFVNCEGIICSAGFETPAEAIYMGKKLCVVPMKNQYEQACNAAFLSELGITVIQNLSNTRVQFEEWLIQKRILKINYPNNIAGILQSIVETDITTSKTA